MIARSEGWSERMRHIARMLSVGVGLLLAGCASAGEEASRSSAAALSDFVSATISVSGGCLGKCPSYEVRIDADGAVQFYGQGSPPAQAQARLAKENVAAVAAAFQQYRFAEMRDRYEPGGDDCREFDSDSSVATIRLRSVSADKSVFFYLGCENATRDRFLSLLKALEVSVEVDRWLKS